MMQRILLLAALVQLVSACNSPSEKTQPNVYYNVEGFIKEQIDKLTAEKPMVEKSVQLNNGTQQQSTRTINWPNELELFVQADINKPAFRKSYIIEHPDSLTYHYTLKPEEEKLTVRSLTVHLDSATHQPQQITALLKTKNPLYESERQLLLESGLAANRQWRVKRYQITGFQQLRFFDRNQFSIKAEIQ